MERLTSLVDQWLTFPFPFLRCLISFSFYFHRLRFTVQFFVKGRQDIGCERHLATNLHKEINESVKIEIKKMINKYSHKDVVEFISKKEDLPKKMIYNFCLSIKKKS